MSDISDSEFDRLRSAVMEVIKNDAKAAEELYSERWRLALTAITQDVAERNGLTPDEVVETSGRPPEAMRGVMVGNGSLTDTAVLTAETLEALGYRLQISAIPVDAASPICEDGVASCFV